MIMDINIPSLKTAVFKTALQNPKPPNNSSDPQFHPLQWEYFSSD